MKKGSNHSEESKLKMSINNACNNLGKHLSEETKQKLCLAHLGKKLSEEHKRNIRIGSLGKIISEETRKKLRASQSDEKGHRWKGDDVGYGALHTWIKKKKEKPEFCEICGKEKPYDLANISGEYKRDVNDFQFICRRCHVKQDGRLEKANMAKRMKAIVLFKRD